MYTNVLLRSNTSVASSQARRSLSISVEIRFQVGVSCVEGTELSLLVESDSAKVAPHSGAFVGGEIETNYIYN